MKTVRIVTIALLLCLMATMGKGQMFRPDGMLHTHSEKAAKFYDAGLGSLKSRDFKKAYKYFQKALKKDENFPEAYLQIATILTFAERGPGLDGVPKESSVGYYQKYIDLIGVTAQSKPIHLRLGNIYLSEGDYEKAEAVLRKVNGKVEAEQHLILQKHLNTCSFAKQAMAKPVELAHFTRMPPTVNAFKAQYFPSITADGNLLAYTVIRTTPQASREQEDIFISTFENGEWGQGKPISEKINSPDNEGTCSISGDGKSMVFTSCINQRHFQDCNLYYTKKVGDVWSKPKPLSDKINTKHWESQPSLTADGRKLYYISDRPDGMGGKDIWLTTLDDQGEWTPPTNLGGQINTRDEELSPFIHANGKTLYFASDGHLGMGKKDLFMTEAMGSMWSEPVNLGYPLNSHYDEVAIVINPASTIAYYTKDSVANGQHVSNIYEFKLPPSMKPKHRSYFVEGKVVDSLSHKAVAAKLELINTSDEEVISRVFTDSLAGEYLVSMPEGGEYAFYVEAEGYLFKSLHFEVHEETSKDIHLTIPLVPLRTGMVTRLNNIFFEFDKYVLLPESETELKKVVLFLEKNPKISIEIRGHTDDKGTQEYNQNLSDKRAEAVKNYLVEQGVAAARVSSKGFGEDQPLVSNDSDANRALNRRIEFAIK